MNFFKTLLIAAIFICPSGALFATGKAKQVVLIVWDGMRPDFISPSNTPALSALAERGVMFLHHHSVYPSMTEVNATAFATGMYPEQSEVLANHEFRPSYNSVKPIETDNPDNIRQGDSLTGNHYIAFPTVAEMLRAHGLRTVIAGTKPVALLHDRAARGTDSLGVTLSAGNISPESRQAELTAALGTFPISLKDKIAADHWTASALTGPLWSNGVPPFSLLWLGEPDGSQHRTSPGSPESLRAIKSSDDNLALVLRTLRERHLEDSTDVIVASDHGFSTIAENINVLEKLQDAGFHAFGKFPTTTHAADDVLVVGNGGAVFFYFPSHNAEAAAKLIHFLQSQPYAAVIFSRAEIAGTFPLSRLKMNAPSAPDVIMVMQWKPDQNHYGASGFIDCYGGPLGMGQGQHASLGPSDMHNTCVAAGPDFTPGMTDALPSGNIDIAPTILWILGIEPKHKLSGRVLTEALTIPGPAIQSSQRHHAEAKWQSTNFLWRQFLDTSEVNGVIYFDQGNGGQMQPVK